MMHASPSSLARWLTPLMLGALVACGGKRDAADGKPAKAGKKAEGHVHHAPHGGALVELGDEAGHVELVLDPAEGKLTAYALDGEAESAVRLKQTAIEAKIKPAGATEVKISLTAVANALTGETVGDTSEFEAKSDALKGLKAFTGSITSVDLRGLKFENAPFSFPQGNE